MTIHAYNVTDRRSIRKLYTSNRFIRYPDMFLNNTCRVKVNQDDYLVADEFTIFSKSKNLPKKILIYGKKTGRTNLPIEDNLYLNYWMDVFLQTVEHGYLCKYDLKKSESKTELTIGLPLHYRRNAFNTNLWKREDIIKFISCLFNTELEEIDYEQQDLIENLLVA